MRLAKHAAAIVLTVALIAAVPISLSAQQLRRQGPREKVLVLPPGVSSPADSGYSIALTDEIRERLISKSRFRITTIPKATISEALEASGFPPNAILDATTAEQLARFLSAHAFVTGQITRNSGPKVDLRVIDVGRSGASGQVTMSCSEAAQLKDCAEGIVDSLDIIFRSAEKVRDCLEERDKSKWDNAVKRAREALERYAGNGSAYLCIATSFELQEMPDSQADALRAAADADPSNPTVWDRLFRVEQQRGDSIGALNALLGKLTQATPNDAQLRLGIAVGLDQLGMPDSALTILDHGLEINPADLAMLEQKERICTTNSDWSCILATLPVIGGLDSTRIDSTYFLKLVGAAQQSSDTAALIRWTSAAVRRSPDRADLWKVLGDAYRAREQNDSALIAFEHALGLDSTDVNSALAVAQARLQSDQVNDVTWRVLNLAADQGNPQQRAIAAALMISYTQKFFQITGQAAVKEWPRVIQFGERALEIDPTSRNRGLAAYLLGIAYLQEVGPRIGETAQNPESWTCQLAAQYSVPLKRGQNYLMEGASIAPEQANSLVGTYTQFSDLLKQVDEILKCS